MKGFAKSEVNPNEFLQSLLSITALGGTDYKKLVNVYDFSDARDGATSHLLEIWKTWVDNNGCVNGGVVWTAR